MLGVLSPMVKLWPGGCPYVLEATHLQCPPATRALQMRCEQRHSNQYVHRCWLRCHMVRQSCNLSGLQQVRLCTAAFGKGAAYVQVRSELE